MRNNVLDKVNMKTAGFNSSRFNLSNDFNTTLQFGVVYPTHTKYCHEGTNKVDSFESLFYLAPMPVRTWGRIKAKMYHQFVNISDLFPKLFSALLSQTPVATAVAGIIKNPVLPYIGDKRILSAFALTGAKLSIWFGERYDGSTASELPSYETFPADTRVFSMNERNELGTDVDDMYNLFKNRYYSGNGIYSGSGTSRVNVLSRAGLNNASSWSDVTKNAFGCKLPENAILLNPFALFDTPAAGVPTSSVKKNCLIPLGNELLSSCCADYSSYHSDLVLGNQKQGLDPQFYSPGSDSDVVITKWLDYTTTTGSGSTANTTYHRRRVYFVFRLSDYGKRIKAFLEGCGYKLNFHSSEQEGITTLLATYKAYYDLFSINLYENFENSVLGKFCTFCDNGGYWSDYNNLIEHLETSGFGAGVDQGLLARVIAKFGDMFYTEEQDYLGAHINNTSVSPSARSCVAINYDIDGGANVQGVDSQDNHIYTTQQGQGHDYINGILHGQLDSEFLKRAYRWVNRNTIAGQRIAQILRAQGLGDYVDSCKSNFIGYDETQLKVDSVLAQADTFVSSTNQGSQLGQRAGVGIGYNEGKKVFKFTNNEIGLTVSFVTIVPNSGYCQGEDPVTTKLITKSDFYQPEFDALGYEATTFESIVDTTKTDGSACVTNSTFGLVPRMSKFKVARNKMSGNFSLPSEQDSFLPYTLDKYMPLNKLITRVYPTAEGSRHLWAEVVNPLQMEAIPTCGEVWRKVGKYAYIQNFNRIFSYVGNTASLASSVVGNNWSEFVVRDADNFILQLINNDQSYMKMKPIEDSFETDDDGKTNTSMDKA